MWGKGLYLIFLGGKKTGFNVETLETAEKVRTVLGFEKQPQSLSFLPHPDHHLFFVNLPSFCIQVCVLPSFFACLSSRFPCF